MLARILASRTSMPPRMRRCASQPPVNPPSVAAIGGIQAYPRFASVADRACRATRKAVVQFVHRLYTVIDIMLAATSETSRTSRNISPADARS